MALLLALAAMACGSDPPPPPPPTPAPTSSRPTPSPTSREDGQGDSWLIRWLIELGPSAPVPPAQDPPPSAGAYEPLTNRDCALAVAKADQLPEPRQRSLYRGAGSACLAAFNGRQDLWARAEAELAQVRVQPGYLYCWDRDTYRLLETLVRLHRENPARSFATARGGGGTATCPRIVRLEPDHGRPGDRIVIHGARLSSVTRVYFNYANPAWVPARADPSGQRIVVEAVPAAGAPGQPVLVWVDANPPGSFFDPAGWFTYDQKQTTGSTTTAPSSSTTAPTSTT